jgi:hypothetical protein
MKSIKTTIFLNIPSIGRRRNPEKQRGFLRVERLIFSIFHILNKNPISFLKQAIVGIKE